jgi:hypothetical protein
MVNELGANAAQGRARRPSKKFDNIYNPARLRQLIAWTLPCNTEARGGRGGGGGFSRGGGSFGSVRNSAGPSTREVSRSSTRDVSRPSGRDVSGPSGRDVSRPSEREIVRPSTGAITSPSQGQASDRLSDQMPIRGSDRPGQGTRVTQLPAAGLSPSQQPAGRGDALRQRAENLSPEQKDALRQKYENSGLKPSQLPAEDRGERLDQAREDWQERRD